MATKLKQNELQQISKSMIRTEKQAKNFNGDRIKVPMIHFCGLSRNSHDDETFNAFLFGNNDAIIITDETNELIYTEVINPDKTKEDIEKEHLKNREWVEV